MNTWLIVDYGGVLAEDHVARAEFELSNALGAQAGVVRDALSEKSLNGRSLRLDRMSELEFWNAICREICPIGFSFPPAEELTRLWANCYAIRPDVADILCEVQSLGVSIGIATNVDRYREQYLLDELARSSMIPTVWSSYKIGFLKPSVDYFLHIESEISRNRGQPRCLYVDDRQTHVDAASTIGWTALKASHAEHIRVWLKHQNVLK